MTSQPFKNQQTQTKQVVSGGGPAFAPYFENITFPKSRDAILQVIEENTENDTDDNQAIMERFRQMPDAVYNNIEDIKKALGEKPDSDVKMEAQDVRTSQADRR